MTLAGLLDGGEGTDTLTIRGDAYSSSLEVIGSGSICNFERVKVGDSLGGDLLGSLTFTGDSALQEVDMSGTNSGTLDLDAGSASALKTVTLKADNGTDTIHISWETGKYAGEDGVTISNFEGGSDGDELDVYFFSGSSVVVESGSSSGFQVASGTNVLIVTDTNELDAGNFDDGGIEIAANTDYIVIASAGSGTAHIYLVNAGGDTTVTTDEITPIATIETIGSAITADNILV